MENPASNLIAARETVREAILAYETAFEAYRFTKIREIRDAYSTLMPPDDFKLQRSCDIIPGYDLRHETPSKGCHALHVNFKVIGPYGCVVFDINTGLYPTSVTNVLNSGCFAWGLYIHGRIPPNPAHFPESYHSTDCKHNSVITPHCTECFSNSVGSTGYSEHILRRLSNADIREDAAGCNPPLAVEDFWRYLEALYAAAFLSGPMPQSL